MRLLASQIPECTSSTYHNAPFKTEMCTFLFWMEHCGIWNRRILGFVKLVYWVPIIQWYYCSALVVKLWHSLVQHFAPLFSCNSYALTSLKNPRMRLFHTPQRSIQNRNMHISVLNGALWDMEHTHSGICEIGLLGANYWSYCSFSCQGPWIRLLIKRLYSIQYGWRVRTSPVDINR